MREPHRLEYETEDRHWPEPVEARYALILFLNQLSVACSVGFFVLVVLVSADRMGWVVGLLGVPLGVGHLLIAGLPAWVYVASNRSREAAHRTRAKLLILSLIPVALVLLAWGVLAVVPKTK